MRGKMEVDVKEKGGLMVVVENLEVIDGFENISHL